VTSLLPDQEMAKSLKEARAEFDRAYLIRLLELCGGSAAKAAQIAGKYRADFYDLLKKRGIKIQDFRKADCLVGNITRESGKSLQIGSPESASRALAPTRQ
jgi:predicted HTH domain antitoxin